MLPITQRLSLGLLAKPTVVWNRDKRICLVHSRI